MTAHRSALVLLLLSAFIFGCAPRLQPTGTGQQPPDLSDGAVIMSDGIALPLRSWVPEDTQIKAVAVALHGFNDHSAAFDTVGPVLRDKGIAVYAPDQRGFGRAPHHGLWAGAARMTQDVRDSVSAVRARHPDQPIFLIGESMGGAVVMAALAEPNPPQVDGAVLIAPAVWGRATMNPVQTGALWLLAHTVPGLTLRPEGLNIEPSDNVAMLRALSKDPYFIKDTRVDAIWGLVNLMDRALAASNTVNAALLLLYGQRDEIVPKTPTCDAIERLSRVEDSQSRFALYPGGYHMLTRDLNGERPIADIAAWILDPAGALPSAAEVEIGHQRLKTFCD